MLPPHIEIVAKSLMPCVSVGTTGVGCGLAPGGAMTVSGGAQAPKLIARSVTKMILGKGPFIIFLIFASIPLINLVTRLLYHYV